MWGICSQFPVKEKAGFLRVAWHVMLCNSKHWWFNYFFYYYFPDDPLHKEDWFSQWQKGSIAGLSGHAATLSLPFSIFLMLAAPFWSYRLAWANCESRVYGHLCLHCIECCPERLGLFCFCISGRGLLISIPAVLCQVKADIFWNKCFKSGWYL